MSDIYHNEVWYKKRNKNSFYILQLNQTYLGKDSTWILVPKSFTGEKYGGK